MEWFEDQSFWEKVYPQMFPDSRMEKAEADADDIIALTAIQEGRILDLCCGPGRFSTAFARRGFHVTGVDATECLLNTAIQRASLEDLDIEWIKCDMREFSREGYFDLALNMFTSFGYFENHEDNLKVLSNIRRSLRNGGIAVMEMMGKEVLASIFNSVSLEELDDGTLLVQKHTIQDGWQQINNDWILLDDSGVQGRWRFTHWVYSASELKTMLLQTGFNKVKIYGSIKGIPYDDRASRLLAVATA